MKQHAGTKKSREVGLDASGLLAPRFCADPGWMLIYRLAAALRRRAAPQSMQEATSAMVLESTT